MFFYFIMKCHLYRFKSSFAIRQAQDKPLAT
jgi:hypothetical protein